MKEYEIVMGLNTSYGKVVLDDGAGDTGDVNLLKTVPAEQGNCHVAGDGDKGDTVKISVGDAGDKVGGSGTACGNDHTGFACDPGETVGGVGGVLFMGAEHMVETVGVFVQFVIDGQDRTAGISENGFDIVAAQ